MCSCVAMAIEAAGLKIDEILKSEIGCPAYVSRASPAMAPLLF